MNALLIGNPPPGLTGYRFVTAPPYEAVVIGSLTVGELLCFRDERALEALAKGVPVILYTPGLPQTGNRSLAASLAGARRQLKNWGVQFTDGAQKHLVTAAEAERLRRRGEWPGAGAVLTPLAREILEGAAEKTDNRRNV